MKQNVIIRFILFSTLFYFSCNYSNNKEKQLKEDAIKINIDKNTTYDREIECLNYFRKKEILPRSSDSVISILSYRQICDCIDPISLEKINRLLDLNDLYNISKTYILYEYPNIKEKIEDFDILEVNENVTFLYESSNNFDKAGFRKSCYLFIVNKNRIIYWEDLK